MTPHQVELVQASWEKVVPIAKDAADLFYGKLFELNPALRPLFHGDVEEQGKKLMQILTTVVRGLKQFDKLEMAVWQLGRRHVAYQISIQDFNTVAEALLWTLQQGLQQAFSAEVKQAWVEAYTIVAGVMQAGMEYEYANFDKWKAAQQ
ncbi:globin family protein [Pseudoalteromonas tunicata]|jgi:hemoglobin-like flavoprotein|uniref:Probable bacterial hemoglobin n=1 Tax=Pseudoalteromonas tunicata D2 TaxID=87626 RepID=A4C946_9GAMM|nr:globin family protein [Pseudoalteromonas tunicata]ATC93613.1 nitric oxide dioxygenase [Pseudoalteromonas tunicata]AXT29449.1 hemin receptor [Pseudoalteromonas tunicata]EAR29111.1 probable bacterial hemoglobin [Pseudoalteromonas tunicata D2]MDP4983172.1 globin domain-containing protein [Pseudoalteromonas tunicata]MDP5211828.1 globin family protein [Pseudoalteromonas tunicata]